MQPLARIVELENAYNALLPLHWSGKSPVTELLAVAKEWSEVVWMEALQSGSINLSAKQVNQGLTLARHPVFICGVHRSGTTLARDLLDDHPDLVVLPSEGTYYTHLERKIIGLPESQQVELLGQEWLRRLANPINQPPYWLLGRSSESSSSYIDFIKYLLAWWKVLAHTNGTSWPHIAVTLAYACCLNRLSCMMWVDKTPGNEKFLTRIWNEMPEARIIQLVRNPKAILASRKKMDPYFNLRHVLSDLKASFDIAHKQSDLKDPRYLLLRYEELLKFPEQQLKRLVSFLNISILPVLTTPTVAGIAASANSSFDKNAVAGKILVQGRDQHVNDLTHYESEALTACLDRSSARLRYPLKSIGFFRKLYLRLKLRLL